MILSNHNHNTNPAAPANIDECWLELVADPELLELAFAWCCRSRQHFPPSADIWWVRERWHSIKPQLIRELLEGNLSYAKSWLMAGWWQLVWASRWVVRSRRY